MTGRIGRRVALLVALLGALVVLAGCAGAIGSSQLTPKLSPPVIARPGILRAAVDLRYPPFAGVADGAKVGLDVDVAAAVAEQLGLKLELVDATSTAGAALVRAGTVDIALGGMTVDQAVSSQLAFAGTYVSDGPAVFASNSTTAAVDDLSSQRIAVQKDSAAYWALLDEYGEDPLVVMPTLLDAFKSVSAGKADVVAGDALVGAYIARGFPNLRYLGQVGTVVPLGVGVSTTKPKLESEVRMILDRLASRGVLETLRRKWAAGLPVLKVATSSDVSQGTTGSLGASVTP